MTIYLREINSQTITNREGIAVNNLDLTIGATFLKRDASQFITKATAAADRIIGVNQTEAVYASDNQTVAQKTVKFIPKEIYAVYEVAVNSALVLSDEGKFFSLASSDLIDNATRNVAPTGKQFECVKFINATKGLFRIINL